MHSNTGRAQYRGDALRTEIKARRGALHTTNLLASPGSWRLCACKRSRSPPCELERQRGIGCEFYPGLLVPSLARPQTQSPSVCSMCAQPSYTLTLLQAANNFATKSTNSTRESCVRAGQKKSRRPTRTASRALHRPSGRARAVCDTRAHPLAPWPRIRCVNLARARPPAGSLLLMADQQQHYTRCYCHRCHHRSAPL
jgi:hypothetical protein